MLCATLSVSVKGEKKLISHEAGRCVKLSDNLKKEYESGREKKIVFEADITKS